MTGTDYKVELDGLVIVFQSERSTQRTPQSSTRVHVGARLAFKTKHDTAQFIRVAEAEGFTVEGKQFIDGF